MKSLFAVLSFAAGLAGASVDSKASFHGILPRGAAVQADSTAATPCQATLLPNYSPAMVCGTAGSLKTPKLSQSLKATTAQACANACLSNPAHCTAFGFSKKKASCQLYSASLAAMGYKKYASGPVRYYTRGCFACTNMMLNGNFGDGSWSPWVLGYQNDASNPVASPGYRAPYAGQISASGGDGQLALTYPTFSVTEGQEYLFSFDYKLVDTTVSVFFVHYEGLLGILASPDNPGGYGPTVFGKWAHFSTSFVPQSTDQRIELVFACTNSSITTDTVVASFDNFQFVPYASAIYTNESATTGPNIVTEPDFNSGTTDAYQLLTSGNVTTSIVQPGAGAAANALNLAFADDPNDYAYVLVSQQMPAVNFGAYAFNMDFRSDTALNGSVILVMQSIDSAFIATYEAGGNAFNEEAVVVLLESEAGVWGTVTGVQSLQTGNYLGVFAGIYDPGAAGPINLELGNIRVEPLF